MGVGGRLGRIGPGDGAGKLSGSCALHQFARAPCIREPPGGADVVPDDPALGGILLPADDGPAPKRRSWPQFATGPD